MPITDSRLDQLTDEAVNLLSELIRIPALSKEEDKRATYFYQYLIQNGLAPVRLLNNIIVRNDFMADPSRPKLLLNSHIDTVRPSNTWTIDPHDPINQHGRLHGIGSNDAGASLVSLLMAYRYLVTTSQSYDLIYAATAEEEISGSHGIVHVIHELPEIQLAIVGEPTGMQMAIAEKGLMVIDAVAYGISGHAARDEGKNAIYAALQDIEKIKNYSFERISELLGPTKATVTVIQAGNQHNVIPDQCKYVIDVRSNEMYSNEEIHQLLQKEIQSVLTPRSYRLKSSHISMVHPVVIRGIGQGLTCYGSPTLSDQALMPYTSIKIGPGQSSRSHTADEYIEIEEIRHGIKTYIELLDGLNIK